MPVYFAQAEPGGPIKIGSTNNVEGRLRQLEKHYGRPLTLLATKEGGEPEERAIQARFSHLRLNRSGKKGVQPEQFRPAAELAEFMGLVLPPEPEVVEPMPGAVQPGQTIGFRVSAEYAAWLNGAVRHSRLDIAKFIDNATMEYAKSLGFEEKPPRRVP